MNIIVSGATSMLGLALIEESIKHGTKVIALVRENSEKIDLLPHSPLISIVECDISGFPALSLNGEADIFYHFAWEKTESESHDDVDAHARNIIYTLDAVRLAHRSGCRRFVGAGSQAEYGRVEGTVSPNIRVAPDSAYGAAKYAACRLASILCEQLDMDIIWTRTFGVYGKHNKPSTIIMHCIDALLQKERPILTKCEQYWDYLHCSDAARAFYLLGDKGKNGQIYNIGSGETKPLSEFVYMLRDAINPGLELGIGEREYAPKQVMHLCADISNLTRDTGFVPEISFRQGIAETVEWYKKYKNA